MIKDIGHQREERQKAKLGNGAQEDPNPGPEGHVEEGANHRDASPYLREAEPPQPPSLKDLDTEENKEVPCGVEAIKIEKQSPLKAVKEPFLSENTHKTRPR